MPTSKKKKYKPLICLDSLVFIAWFKGEAGKPLDRIQAVLEEGKNGIIQIMVSCVSRVEVLNIAKNPTARDQFMEFLKKSYVTEVFADHNVYDLGAVIRERSIKANSEGTGKKIKQNDALIAATAILHNAQELHSLDEALLKAGGTAIVDGLRIREPAPWSRQIPLNFGA